jgi:hypothetical protein
MNVFNVDASSNISESVLSGSAIIFWLPLIESRRAFCSVNYMELPFTKITACSLGLSATSQQYFSLRTNQPPTTSQQYFSLRTNQHQPPAERTGYKMIHLVCNVNFLPCSNIHTTLNRNKNMKEWLKNKKGKQDVCSYSG